MSKVCDICTKSYLKGNLVKRGIGRRVTRRTITKQEPNLFEKKIVINDSTVKLKVCSSCLKRIKYENRLNQEKATNVVVSSKATSAEE